VRYGIVLKFKRIIDEGDPYWNDFRFEKELNRFRLRFDTRNEQTIIYLSRYSLEQLYRGIKQLLEEASKA